jgi:hypothetical protein
MWNTLFVLPYYVVPQPVYFTWQCAIRYHNQCLSPDNVSCLRQPMYFSWQCVIWYHDQYLSPGKLWYHITHFQMKYTGCGTVRHIARLHWSWCSITHCHVKYTGCGTVWHITRWNTLVVIPYDILLGERDWLWYRITPVPFTWQRVMLTTTNVFQLTMCHMVPRPVPFTGESVMRYHDQCNLALS